MVVALLILLTLVAAGLVTAIWLKLRAQNIKGLPAFGSYAGVSNPAMGKAKAEAEDPLGR